MTIRLRTDPATGKKDIVVSLRSDEDALPIEHEQQHRALVQRLIEGGLVKAEELGQVVVEREEEAGGPRPARVEAPGVDPDLLRAGGGAGRSLRRRGTPAGERPPVLPVAGRGRQALGAGPGGRPAVLLAPEGRRPARPRLGARRLL